MIKTRTRNYLYAIIEIYSSFRPVSDSGREVGITIKNHNN